MFVWVSRVCQTFILSLLLSGAAARAGSLSGRVTSSSTGQGLANAYLDLYDEDGLYFDYTVSGSNGIYVFSNLGSGTFYVHTDTLGYYADEWYDHVPGAADALYFNPLEAGATPVPVALSDNVSGINFSLDQAGSLSGIVTTSGGGAVTNIYVDTYLADGTRFISALTDSTGAYTIRGLPAGSYAARTDTLGALQDLWNDGSKAFDELSPVDSGVSMLSVSSGGSLNTVHFHLPPGASVEGVIQSGTGDPVPGMYVDLYDPAGRRLEFDRSDTNGLYRIDGLPAGTYYLGTYTLGEYIDLWYDQVLMVNASQPVTDGATLVTVPDTAQLTGFNFTLDRGSSIHGSVFSPGPQPVEGAFVDVYLASTFYDFAVTDDTGAFTVPGLPTYTYYVKVDTLGAWIDEWHQDHAVRKISDPLADAADPVIIASTPSTTNLLFNLEPGASISGRLTGPGGQAAPHVYVDLCDAGGQRLYYTQGDSNGMYQLGGLLAGTYYLRTDSQDLLVDEWYDNSPVLSGDDPIADQATPLMLTNRQVLAGIDLALVEGAFLSGAVTTISNAPMAFVEMRLFHGDLLYDLAYTDTNGLYAFSTLPAGTYHLRTDNDQERIDEWYQDVYIFHAGEPGSDGAAPIVLANSDTLTGIDFNLGLGSDIEGWVGRSGGVGLMDVTVDIYDSLGRYYDFTLTAPSGNFAVELLPPGTWYIGTDTFGAYVDEWYNDVGRDPFFDPLTDGATPLITSEGVVLTGVDFTLEWPPALPVDLRLQLVNRSALLEWDAEARQAYQVERCFSLPLGDWVDAPSATLSIEQSYKPASSAGLRQYRDPAPTGSAHYRVLTSD